MIVADLQEAFREVAEYVNDPVSFHEIEEDIGTGSTIVFNVGVVPERIRLNYTLFCACVGTVGYFGYAVGWCDIWFVDNTIVSHEMVCGGLYKNYPLDYIRSNARHSTTYVMTANAQGNNGGATMASLVATPTWDKNNQTLTLTFTATNTATGINRAAVKLDVYRR